MNMRRLLPATSRRHCSIIEARGGVTPRTDGERFEEDDSVRHMEGLYMPVSQETLTRLAKATAITGSIGKKDFKLKRDHQKAIKAFLNHFPGQEGK